MELSSMTMKDVMTPSPVQIDEDADLSMARHMLREKGIRHLPVTHQGALTGILSERDTRMVALVPGIAKVGVAEVMSRRPLAVSPDTSVIEAVSKMAAKKYGCVVVTDPKGGVVGIFTSQDALRLLLDNPQRPATGAPANLFAEPEDEIVDDLDDCLG